MNIPRVFTVRSFVTKIFDLETYYVFVNTPVQFCYDNSRLACSSVTEGSESVKRPRQETRNARACGRKTFVKAKYIGYYGKPKSCRQVHTDPA